MIMMAALRFSTFLAAAAFGGKGVLGLMDFAPQLPITFRPQLTEGVGTALARCLSPPVTTEAPSWRNVDTTEGAL